jgi:hypothetical protein
MPPHPAAVATADNAQQYADTHHLIGRVANEAVADEREGNGLWDEVVHRVGEVDGDPRYEGGDERETADQCERHDQGAWEASTSGAERSTGDAS